jgi:hypothetical protein
MFVIQLQFSISLVQFTLHASHRLYKKKKKKKTFVVVDLLASSRARTNPLTSALLRLLAWRISALDLRLTALLS